MTVDDLLNAGHYVYVSGAAGTGKTYLARQLASREDTLLCATTGIAAVNLGDAVTVNSLLGFFDLESLMDAFATARLQQRLRNLIKMGIRRLVVDEISMMSANTLTILVHALEEVASTKGYDADLAKVVEDERDDRRIQLILVGDFAQLPPIDEPFAFESEEWWRFEEHIFKLEKIRRTGDEAYIKALLAVRRGDPAAALPALRGRFVPRLNLLDFPGTTIVSKNVEVDRVNGIRHAQLKGTPLEWKTVRSGEQRKEWIQQIPNELQVKPGALVMVLANLYNEDGKLVYANGDTGEVLEKIEKQELSAEEIEAYEELGIDPPAPTIGIKILLKRTLGDVVVQPVTREWTEPYVETEEEKQKREAEEQRLKIKIRKPKVRVKGTITYMPLRLAWATTVHKSQGLSLDQVQVAIAGPGSWMFEKPGMTYVALSRCRSLEGLTIVGNERTFLGKCSVDGKVRQWI